MRKILLLCMVLIFCGVECNAAEGWIKVTNVKENHDRTYIIVDLEFQLTDDSTYKEINTPKTYANAISDMEHTCQISFTGPSFNYSFGTYYAKVDVIFNGGRGYKRELFVYRLAWPDFDYKEKKTLTIALPTHIFYLEPGDYSFDFVLTDLVYLSCFDGPTSYWQRAVGDVIAKETVTFTIAGQCTDRDGDGFNIEGTEECGPKDCNDTPLMGASINPGAIETCNFVDDNCDGVVDEELNFDDDNDGHYSIDSCMLPNDDCSDFDSGIFPGNDEVCGDGIDNNCDGQIDEDCCPIVNGFSIANVSIDAEGNVNTSFNVDIEGDGYESKINIQGRYSTSGRVGDGAFREGLNTAGLIVEKEGCDTIVTPPQTFVIVQDKKDCKYSAIIGSQADLASGELTETVELFNTSGSGVNTDFDLHYLSRDGNAGPLGQNWTHSYNIYLVEDDSSNVGVRNGSGNWNVYTPSGSSYISRQGDYNSLSKLVDGTFELTKKNGTVYAFGANNNISAIIDRNGSGLTFTYDGDDLIEIIEAVGRVTSLNYDGSGKLISVTDPAGKVYAFNVGTTLDSITLPNTSSWQFTYQDTAYMTAKTDPVGNLTSYYYDSLNRVIETVSPEGQVRSIIYPEEGETVRTTTFTEKDGSQWDYTYDVNLGLLTEKTDPEGNTTSYTYDNNRNKLSKTESGVGTTNYTYDGAGNMASITNPDGNTTTYAYNQYGQILTISDSEDSSTTYEYDEKGNLISITQPDETKSSYIYDEQGRLIGFTDAAGRSTALTYDAAGNVETVTGPDGGTTTFEYDVVGNRIKTIDASGNETSYEYDGSGNVVKLTDADGKLTQYEYDANGNRSKVTDANGNSTTFTYNAQGQMINMTDALEQTTSFEYNGSSGCSSCGGGVDKLTSLTDAKGQTTKFKYDVLGQLIQETDPLGNSTAYGYSPAGQVASKTDPNGNTISYGYDASGRLLKKTYPDSSEATFSYDNRGNLLTAANRNITYTYKHDTGNRPIKVEDNRGYELNYTYDASGNRKSLNGSFNIDVDYNYDDVGRLSNIASAAGDIAFGYDDLSRRSKLTFPNGVVTTYSYDDLGRLTDLLTMNGAELITQALYTHDNVGNRMSKANDRTTMSYSYDDTYRLTEAIASTPGFSSDKGKGKNGKNNSNATQNQREYYQYDQVGNRITSSEHNTYTHNIGNELLTADATTYSYDANGNRTQKTTSNGTTIYTWDYDNQLIRATLPDGSGAEYFYGPFGRRIAKTVVGVDGSKTTNFLYDSEDIVAEIDGAGNVGNVYIHGAGIDEPLALLGKKGATYYHVDGLGSIVSMTDEQARNVQQYEYDSFGNQHDMKNRIKQPYGYTGREHDRETGLRYYRARYYDGEVGIFISEDPIGFAGGVGFYSYVGNGPTVWADPFGLTPTYVPPIAGQGCISGTLCLDPGPPPPRGNMISAAPVVTFTGPARFPFIPPVRVPDDDCDN